LNGGDAWWDFGQAIKSRAKLELKLPRTVPVREMFDGSEMVKRSDEAEWERPGVGHSPLHWIGKSLQMSSKMLSTQVIGNDAGQWGLVVMRCEVQKGWS
jgi:hypothetical protein